MNVRVENLPHSQSVVTAEVEPERVAQAKEAAFRRIAREAVVPGFRKGKAPRHLVERYVRPEAVEDDAEASLADEVWHELLDGQLKDTQIFDAPRVRILTHTPLVLEITYTHEPTVRLGDWTDVRIAPELVTVTDDDVSRMMEGLRQEQAQWQPVQNRAVRLGDMVTVQAHGMIGNQPIVVPEGFSLTVNEQAGWITPGFAMRLVDAEVDKEEAYPVVVPADAADKTTAGTTGTAYVTIKEIKERIAPALDDALAKTLGSDTVAALTDKVRSSLLKQREQAARGRLENKITDAIAKVSTIDFPELFVDQQLDSMIAERSEYLRQRGLDLSLYFQITKTTLEGMRAELRPDAERQIRDFLLVEELIRAEGIVVEESAVSAEVDRLVGEQQDQAAARTQLSTTEMHERLHRNLQIKTLFDRLSALVTEGQEPVPFAPASPIVAEDQEPAGETSPMPAVTDSLPAAGEEPAEGKKETPKLIIATH